MTSYEQPLQEAGSVHIPMGMPANYLVLWSLLVGVHESASLHSFWLRLHQTQEGSHAAQFY
jgi:hypothetical protein